MEGGHVMAEPPEKKTYTTADLDRIRAIMRRKTPVWRDEALGNFVLTRHDDVRALLADRSLLRDPAKAAPESVTMRPVAQPEGLIYRTTADAILTMDDPRHSLVRTPLAKAFYKRVAAARGLIEETVERVLNDLDGSKHFDAMTGFCIPIPIDAIARILGADPSMNGSFRSWSVDAFEVHNPVRTPEQTERMIAAANNLTGYIDDLMERRRTTPQDDLISDLMTAQASGTALTDDEIRQNCTDLLVAGNLATTDLIGNALWLLHTHASEKGKLLEEPGLIAGTIEEVLRFEPPAEGTARIASRDMEIRGCPIRQSQVVVASLRGANRDPEAFPEPDRFDVSRKHQPNVSFGGGSHICIGAPLARMEAQVAVSAFLRRFPGAVLEDEAPPWRTTFSLSHGLSRIDMRV
jgi:cytochrome P450